MDIQKLKPGQTLITDSGGAFRTYVEVRVTKVLRRYFVTDDGRQWNDDGKQRGTAGFRTRPRIMLADAGAQRLLEESHHRWRASSLRNTSWEELPQAFVEDVCGRVANELRLLARAKPR
jgi:hypothetical protein